MIPNQLKEIRKKFREDEEKFTRIILPIVIILATALRLIHLEADFPEGLTWSTAPYSDEGWYSNAAISYNLRGQLYLEGDFNPIVNLPLLQLVQTAVFKVFGMSLLTARFTIIGFFTLMLIGVYSLIRRFSKPTAGLIAVVLLSINFHLFSFSRLAILEIPMTSLLVISLAIAAAADRPNPGRLLLSGLTFSLAVLTKTTALFALPALIFIAWDERQTFREGILFSLILLGIISAILLAHYTWANQAYPEDYLYFNSLNLEPRILLTVQGIGRDLLRTLWHGRVIGPLLYPLTLLLLPIFLFTLEKFRRNRLVIASILWMTAYVFTLSIRGYLPPRYYVTLSLPVVMLISIIAIDRLRPSRLSLLLPLVLGLIGAVNIYQIIDYLRSPRFSLVEAAADIKRRVESLDGTLMGGMANTLSLATSLPSINSKMGTGDLKWRVNRYSPTHYVSVGLDHETIEQLREMGDLVQLESYDVFGNYNNGRQVQLYRLILESD
jgi:4-amino-4-deoxy-L-arabinose transferase-like glycosyltransferase